MKDRREQQLDGGLRDAVALERRQIATDYIRSLPRFFVDRRSGDDRRKDNDAVSKWTRRFDDLRRVA